MRIRWFQDSGFKFQDSDQLCPLLIDNMKILETYDTSKPSSRGTFTYERYEDISIGNHPKYFS